MGYQSLFISFLRKIISNNNNAGKNSIAKKKPGKNFHVVRKSMFGFSSDSLKNLDGIVKPNFDAISGNTNFLMVISLTCLHFQYKLCLGSGENNQFLIIGSKDSLDDIELKENSVVKSIINRYIDTNQTKKLSTIKTEMLQKLPEDFKFSDLSSIKKVGRYKKQLEEYYLVKANHYLSAIKDKIASIINSQELLELEHEIEKKQKKMNSEARSLKLAAIDMVQKYEFKTKKLFFDWDGESDLKDHTFDDNLPKQFVSLGAEESVLYKHAEEHLSFLKLKNEYNLDDFEDMEGNSDLAKTVFKNAVVKIKELKFDALKRRQIEAAKRIAIELVQKFKIKKDIVIFDGWDGKNLPTCTIQYKIINLLLEKQVKDAALLDLAQNNLDVEKQPFTDKWPADDLGTICKAAKQAGQEIFNTAIDKIKKLKLDEKDKQIKAAIKAAEETVIDFNKKIDLFDKNEVLNVTTPENLIKIENLLNELDQTFKTDSNEFKTKWEPNKDELGDFDKNKMPRADFHAMDVFEKEKKTAKKRIDDLKNKFEELQLAQNDLAKTTATNITEKFIKEKIDDLNPETEKEINFKKLEEDAENLFDIKHNDFRTNWSEKKNGNLSDFDENEMPEAAKIAKELFKKQLDQVRKLLEEKSSLQDKFKLELNRIRDMKKEKEIKEKLEMEKLQKKQRLEKIKKETELLTGIAVEMIKKYVFKVNVFQHWAPKKTKLADFKFSDGLKIVLLDKGGTDEGIQKDAKVKLSVDKLLKLAKKGKEDFEDWEKSSALAVELLKTALFKISGLALKQLFDLLIKFAITNAQKAVSFYKFKAQFIFAGIDFKELQKFKFLTDTWKDIKKEELVEDAKFKLVPTDPAFSKVWNSSYKNIDMPGFVIEIAEKVFVSALKLFEGLNLDQKEKQIETGRELAAEMVKAFKTKYSRFDENDFPDFDNEDDKNFNFGQFDKDVKDLSLKKFEENWNKKDPVKHSFKNLDDLENTDEILKAASDIFKPVLNQADNVHKNWELFKFKKMLSQPPFLCKGKPIFVVNGNGIKYKSIQKNTTQDFSTESEAVFYPLNISPEQLSKLKKWKFPAKAESKLVQSLQEKLISSLSTLCKNTKEALKRREKLKFAISYDKKTAACNFKFKKLEQLNKNNKVTMGTFKQMALYHLSGMRGSLKSVGATKRLTYHILGNWEQITKERALLHQSQLKFNSKLLFKGHILQENVLLKINIENVTGFKKMISNLTTIKNFSIYENLTHYPDNEFAIMKDIIKKLTPYDILIKNGIECCRDCTRMKHKPEIISQKTILDFCMFDRPNFEKGSHFITKNSIEAKIRQLNQFKKRGIEVVAELKKMADALDVNNIKTFFGKPADKLPVICTQLMKIAKADIIKLKEAFIKKTSKKN